MEPNKQGRSVKWNIKDMWDIFEQYKQHCKDTIKHYRPTLIHQTGEIVNVPFQTPLTISGFCSYSNITPQLFYDMCSGNTDEYNLDLIETITRVRTEIETFLDEGSASGNLNASYVAKLRGLKELNETSLKTETGSINIQITGIETEIKD